LDCESEVISRLFEKRFSKIQWSLKKKIYLEEKRSLKNVFEEKDKEFTFQKKTRKNFN